MDKSPRINGHFGRINGQKSQDKWTLLEDKWTKSPRINGHFWRMNGQKSQDKWTASCRSIAAITLHSSPRFGVITPFSIDNWNAVSNYKTFDTLSDSPVSTISFHCLASISVLNGSQRIMGLKLIPFPEFD